MQKLITLLLFFSLFSFNTFSQNVSRIENTPFPGELTNRIRFIIQENR